MKPRRAEFAGSQFAVHRIEDVAKRPSVRQVNNFMSFAMVILDQVVAPNAVGTQPSYLVTM